jgi:murein DD-endopeptidase MepM/ murein hydrolase activator NlpD
MRKVFGALSGHSRFNYLATVAAAVMLGACSTSIERFASNPSDSDPVYTASVKKPKKVVNDTSDDDAIVSQPLEGAQLKQPATKYSYKKPAYKAPSYSEPSYDTAEEQPVAKPKFKKPTYSKLTLDDQGADSDFDAAASEPSNAPFKKKRTATRYSEPAEASEGGATVTVKPGNTLYSIARANGVSVRQLASANGIEAPYSVKLGQKLVVPGRTTAKAPDTPESDLADAEAAPAPKPVKAGGRHQVASGETLYSLGRKYGVSPFAIADLNGLSHDKSLSVGQSLRIPAGGKRVIAKAPVEEQAGEERIASADEGIEAPAPVKLPKQKSADKIAPSAEEIPEAEAQPRQAETQQAELPANPGVPGMRWPVKGRVISEFGPKANGMKNEGINIAVPEGTGVRAAEGGVVAYAGNELKGYGNLVLVRHQGGWVTAYAHNKELFVKRGDTVKRGDVIAKAGQTGSVSSPQLHFEVRKGATAMDPMKFLNSTTASN